MDLLREFLNNFDLYALIFLLIRVAAVLLCIMVHELCHGASAYLLGDPTATRAGRLSLNPLRHIDLVGFAMMLIAHVGWAKPVPVDMRYFKRPKRDMALTALAGPVSNFLMALAALGLGSLLYAFAPENGSIVLAYALLFLCYIAVLSVGLGLFNLIPIPPLDGSRVLFSLLPDRLYLRLMRWERYLMLAVIVLAWFGFFAGPLNVCMGWVLERLCAVTRFPFAFIRYYFGF
ncbi:MAG: site-2 protease family protein [Ruminococcaceae bacterium]|nr:site-2 protease family protein [Oscillospiraceae bacterium]